jgi:hypothetical protein
MSDLYPAAKELSDYVDRVIAHLALTMGIEPAALRVLEHLRAVLEASMEWTAPEDMAFALMEPAHTA